MVYEIPHVHCFCWSRELWELWELWSPSRCQVYSIRPPTATKAICSLGNRC